MHTIKNHTPGTNTKTAAGATEFPGPGLESLAEKRQTIRVKTTLIENIAPRQSWGQKSAMPKSSRLGTPPCPQGGLKGRLMGTFRGDLKQRGRETAFREEP